MFETLAIDVRFALRRLVRRRTYTALTVLTLARGVAGTAAVYGIARRLLLEPLPVRDEEEVVTFWFEGNWSETKFLAVRPEMTDFQHVDEELEVCFISHGGGRYACLDAGATAR